VSVTVCAALVAPTVWLANVRLVGTSCTNVPVPLSATLWGLPVGLSAIDKVAVVTGGLDCFAVNVTVIVQLAPAARLVPQVVVSK